MEKKRSLRSQPEPEIATVSLTMPTEALIQTGKEEVIAIIGGVGLTKTAFTIDNLKIEEADQTPNKKGSVGSDGVEPSVFTL